MGLKGNKRFIPITAKILCLVKIVYLSMSIIYKKHNSKGFPTKYIFFFFTQHIFDKDALFNIKFRLYTNMVS